MIALAAPATATAATPQIWHAENLAFLGASLAIVVLWALRRSRRIERRFL